MSLEVVCLENWYYLMILVKLYYVYKHQRLIPARCYAARPRCGAFKKKTLTLLYIWFKINGDTISNRMDGVNVESGFGLQQNQRRVFELLR